MTTAAQTDKRIQKTRQALREAFFELVLTNSYDEIKVSDIIEKANVGRSTFYQHFKSKDEMLAASMHFPLTTLAECIQPDFDKDNLQWLMEHFWQNRKFAPRIFAGMARRLVVSALADMLEKNLKVRAKKQGTCSALPVSLIAHQLAESQLTVIIDWLLGKGRCSCAKMATHVYSTSEALYQASYQPL